MTSHHVFKELRENTLKINPQTPNILEYNRAWAAWLIPTTNMLTCEKYVNCAKKTVPFRIIQI